MHSFSASVKIMLYDFKSRSEAIETNTNVMANTKMLAQEREQGF